MSPSSSPSNTKGSNDKSQQGPTNEFHILPHPAKSNDPADLQKESGGLRSGGSGAMDAFHARDPYVPSQEIRDNLPPPLSREELRAKQAKLAALNDEN